MHLANKQILSAFSTHRKTGVVVNCGSASTKKSPNVPREQIVINKMKIHRYHFIPLWWTITWNFVFCRVGQFFKDNCQKTSLIHADASETACKYVIGAGLGLQKFWLPEYYPYIYSSFTQNFLSLAAEEKCSTFSKKPKKIFYISERIEQIFYDGKCEGKLVRKDRLELP